MVRNIKHIILFMLLVLYPLTNFSQGIFKFSGTSKRESISFKLVNNIVVFQLEVNGKKLNFILDSGVGSTILFNLNSADSVDLKNVKKIKLQGLGSATPIDAIMSKGNEMKLKNIVGNNQTVYVIFDDSFDLSSKMGITINGIIGYAILKDFVVKINYGSKLLSFYKSESYEYSRSRKYESFNLEFHKLKPYINVEVQLNEDSMKTTPVKLLIDSGGSDAMWLFENSHPDIIAPKKYFRDFLGEGLSGSIYGKRAKIEKLKIGTFEFERPTVSYPDSISVVFARLFRERNGSIGANVLKRFSVIFDYKRGKLTLKKGHFYKEPFYYNRSGIELVYYGKVLVKERANTNFEISQTGTSNEDRVVLDYRYKYTFKPTYKIQKLREGSPAEKAGLMVGDILIKINGKYTYDLKLEEIIQKFYQKEGAKINLLIERYGQNYLYHFRLKDMLK